jgi:nicotinamide-nucleotide amidase
MTSPDPIPVIVEELGRILRERNETITTIESCTGGLVGGALTAQSGISDVYPGGFVTYSNELKQHAVGVQESTLSEFGAVSSQTAIEMAIGGTIHAQANYGIAITGIAGPDGGTDDKPVGTVWICIANRLQEDKADQDDQAEQVDAEIDCRRFVFAGDRQHVRRCSVIASLSMVIQMLNNEYRDLEYQDERLGA